MDAVPIPWSGSAREVSGGWEVAAVLPPCPHIATVSLMERLSIAGGGYSSLKRTAGSSLWDRAVRTLSNFS